MSLAATLNDSQAIFPQIFYLKNVCFTYQILIHNNPIGLSLYFIYQIISNNIRDEIELCNSNNMKELLGEMKNMETSSKTSTAPCLKVEFC